MELMNNIASADGRVVVNGQSFCFFFNTPYYIWVCSFPGRTEWKKTTRRFTRAVNIDRTGTTGLLRD